MEPVFQRFCAVKLSVKDIVEGDIHQQDENSGTYLLVNNVHIHRVNLIGVIVHKDIVGSITSLLIDDGTERIPLKFFEENKNVTEIVIGDGVLVIGKVRVYNGEKYISQEIIKKVPLQWLKVRMAELSLGKDFVKIVDVPQEQVIGEKAAGKEQKNKVDDKKRENTIKKENEEENIQEENIEGQEDDDYLLLEQPALLPFQKILNVIKELDNGSGAMIEEVIEKSPIKDTEQLLQKMLEKGEIFTLSPGKVKVL